MLIVAKLPPHSTTTRITRRIVAANQTLSRTLKSFINFAALARVAQFTLQPTLLAHTSTLANDQQNSHELSEHGDRRSKFARTGGRRI